MENKQKNLGLRGLTSNIRDNRQTEHLIDSAITIISDAVKSSLGPFGQNTIIQDSRLNHTITKDGYTILTKIIINEIDGRVILDLIKRISQKLIRSVGDGSSSSVVISEELYRQIKEFRKNTVQINDTILTNIFRDIIEVLKKNIKEFSKDVSTSSELGRIATISANNDEKIGEIIKEIYDRVGFGAIVSVEKSKTEHTTYEIKKGYEVYQKDLYPVFTTDIDNTIAEYDKPIIFMCDDMLVQSDINFAAQLIQKYAVIDKKPVIFLAKGYDPAFLSFLYENRKENRALPILPLTIATGTENSMNKFVDLSVLLGAIPIRKTKGHEMPNGVIKPEILGTCEKLIATNTIARFVGGGSSPKRISEYIEKLEGEIHDLSSIEDEINRDKEIWGINRRIASLSEVLVNLFIGGQTETEKETKKYLIEDAVLACRSTYEHGYVPGCNMSLILAMEKLMKSGENLASDLMSNGDFAELLECISTALEYAYKMVLNNYFNDEEKCDKIIKESKEKKALYNLKEGNLENINETYIINSVETEEKILDGVFSIITLLVNSNQVLITGF